ncbi:hypothetical protein ABH931_004524 [Streptacidiphilus sp. MAP12-33]|uniref:DUF2264 domain-containing protein n=1 Tax=Streptacidiphilus sp. MAP12-33 TaxID=3156266 RepID=UPI0035182D16
MPESPLPCESSLPPEDRDLSPWTGWTRAHWEAVADGLLLAALRHAGPEQALVNLPGPRPSRSGTRSDGLEGFARTFLLAAFRVAGAGGDDPHGLLPRYAAGLAAGTRTPTADPDATAQDPVSWPVVTDRSQPIVEAASVALALRLTRPWLWDTLDPAVREHVRVWLREVLVRAPVENNWWFFPVTVGGFLTEVGEGEDADLAVRTVARGLDRIETWYRGDGWYTDGRPRAFDHYNGWAFHLYPVLHAYLGGDRALADRYGARLESYLAGYAATFGADGVPMHQGRSLTYRFAAAAPLWAGALTGRTPISPGTTRRLASGALRHFLDRGALDADGLLTLGWHGPYLPAVQTYSGPASPYWASKAFLGLLLPADHPVWTAPEEPAPAARADAVLPLPAPGWLIQSTAADGIVRLHNHGSDDQFADETLPDDPLYARLGHSTATAPVHTGPADQHLALVVDGAPTERGPIRPLGTGPGWAASAHRPHTAGTELPGVDVVSVVLARGAQELHAHLVTGAAPGTEARHSGWAVAGERTTARSVGRTASVRATGERSLVSLLHGGPGFDSAWTVDVAEGTAFGPRAGFPVLSGTVGDGPSVFVAHARLDGSTRASDEPEASGPLPEVELQALAADFQLRVVWPDGGRQLVRLRIDGGAEVCEGEFGEGGFGGGAAATG